MTEPVQPGLAWPADAALDYDVVIPTIARPSLMTLLASLAAAIRAGDWPGPGHIFLVDDRRADGYHFAPIDVAEFPAAIAARVVVLRSYAMGPGPARNVGWGASHATWIAFLDDDVLVPENWVAAVDRDLAAIVARPSAAASYATIVVPRVAGRAPTDWERNVAELEGAHYITADAIVRRSALAAVGGFDPRFPRAFREDADLALRLQQAGFTLERGTRVTTHPVRPAGPWISVHVQRGNADDAMMHAIHGEDWRAAAHAGVGAYERHQSIVAAAVDAGLALLERRRLAALGYALAWALGTALFAMERIVPGPRTRREVLTMLATSLVIPFAAVRARVRGQREAMRLVRPRTRAVLFDRDGTLVADAPVGGDPSRVALLPGARRALDRLREAFLKVGVVTNQPGVAHRHFTARDLAAVDARIEALAGPFDIWAECLHAENAGCACRKPAPGLVVQAARELGIVPAEIVVVGDIGSDMVAARAAGARAILVPTHLTRPAEIASAPHVEPSLERAVDRILSGRV